MLPDEGKGVIPEQISPAILTGWKAFHKSAITDTFRLTYKSGRFKIWKLENMRREHSNHLPTR